jgi:hypothetical protein
MELGLLSWIPKDWPPPRDKATYRNQNDVDWKPLFSCPLKDVGPDQENMNGSAQSGLFGGKVIFTDYDFSRPERAPTHSILSQSSNNSQSTRNECDNGYPQVQWPIGTRTKGSDDSGSYRAPNAIVNSTIGQIWISRIEANSGRSQWDSWGFWYKCRRDVMRYLVPEMNYPLVAGNSRGA